MANLITNHDPYHIHKLFGLASLMNYLLRFYYLFLYGTAFPSHEPVTQAVCSVVIHGILSISSLLLPIPKKRNFSSPMIWREFRLHSITFAMRHVIATTLTLSNAWPEQMLPDASMKLGLIILSIQCASLITEKLGDHEKRTTNSMPYPGWINQERQKGIKDMYTRAQFGATKTIVLGDSTYSFFPLLGIQMAPLLMTLVRKGKISSITYHRIYALSLSASNLALLVRLCAKPDKLMLVSVAFSSLFPLTSLRNNGLSRGVIWSFFVLFHVKLVPILEESFGMSSVVIACALAVYISGINDSTSSLKSRALWILSVLLALTIKRLYYTTDLIYEKAHVEPYIIKCVPLVIVPPILRQIRRYRCLFIDRSKFRFMGMPNKVQTSTTAPDKKDTSKVNLLGQMNEGF